MEKNFEFEDRIIVFLDILGFKDIIKKNQLTDESLVQLLYCIRQNNCEAKFDIKEMFDIKDLEKIDKSSLPPNSKTLITFGGGKTNIKLTNIQPDVYSVSDSIIISLPIKEISPNADSNFFLHVEALIDHIGNFCTQLLWKGICLRGAITFGKVHYNKEKNIITGKPVIEAIETEAKVAVWPRVILGSSFLKHVGVDNTPQENSTFRKFSKLDSYFKCDVDGLYYVPLFNRFKFYSQDQNKNIIENDQARDFMYRIRNIVFKKTISYKEDIRIYSKWYWLLNYVASTIKELEEEIRPYMKEQGVYIIPPPNETSV